MGSAGTEEECRPGSASESLQQPGPVAASTGTLLQRHPPPQPPCPGIDGALGRAPRNARGLHDDRRECPAKRESTRLQSISSAPPLPASPALQADDRYRGYTTGQLMRQSAK